MCENEITKNFMRARFDLHKTVFDVSSAVENCTNTMSCTLPLAFWSQDHVVLEVPEEQPISPQSVNNSDNYDDSSNKTESRTSDPCQEESLIKGYSSLADCHRVIVAESVCAPRKPVYMLFVLLVPIMILCFAYI